jgi:lipoprotein-releasing system permease protein
VAIAVTTAALVVVLSAMNGLSTIVADLYNAFEPDIRITAAKGKFISEGEKLMARVGAVPYVELVSGSLSEKVLIRNGERQALVTVKGVDERFNRITNIGKAVTEGVYGLDEKERNNILLGRGVANQLGINLSSLVYEISLFSPLRGKAASLNPEENVSLLYCTPAGIFSLNDELDFEYAFVNLATARRLLELHDKLSALEIKCAPDETAKVQEELKALLGPEFVVKNRYELNDVLFRSLETEKLATFIILAFILVIATFNIIGALTMLIIEKQKDIYTLYSLGASKKLIRNIFMREGFLITGVGAATGLLLGLFVCWLQIEFHLVKFGSEFIVPYYPIELQLRDFVWIFMLIMLIGFLAALYPVRVFTKTRVMGGSA